VRKKNPTLIDAQELLTDPGLVEKDSALQQAMFGIGGLAEEAAALLSTAAEETVGGIKANALSQMAWLKSAGMRRMLSRSDFAPEDINNGHTSMYLALPPEMLGVHERALRLITNTMVNAAFKGRKRRGKPATLFILDEAAALGNLPVLPKAAAILRGFGGRVWFFYQAKSQPDALFGKNSETIFANCAQVQGFALNDSVGQKYFEERLGGRVLWRKKISKTQWGDVVEYEPSAAFSLRNNEEIGRATGRSSGLQIVLNEGGDPFLLRRTSYRKMFKPGHFAADPYEPQAARVREKAMELLRRAVMAVKEWRQ
jgi:type IV secretion system protein VirD4